MRRKNLQAFEEYFYRDLDKGFTADIACCDECYDDFLAMWPLADHADEHYFQTTSIDLDTFYSGSYLRDRYSKQEFDSLVGQLHCPRCSSPLRWNIWVYNLPFSVPEDFERTLREVSELARSTPFLLLDHRFCRELLASIKELHKSVKAVTINESLFRARSTKREDVAAEVGAFNFPPARYVQEGRYNHAGNPVLYLGSDKETCQAELRGEACLVLEFKLNAEIKILDLTDPFDSHGDFGDLLNCLVYSALVSAKHGEEGMHRPHYVVSRFVADCARISGFDAVKYPSTRRTMKNFNLVVVNQDLGLPSFATAIAYHRMEAS